RARHQPCSVITLAYRPFLP
ncbi:conserved region in glutamate synthase family protein, partial [Vibrio parahaemolyticus V-223/04]